MENKDVIVLQNPISTWEYKFRAAPKSASTINSFSRYSTKPPHAATLKVLQLKGKPFEAGGPALVVK